MVYRPISKSSVDSTLHTSRSLGLFIPTPSQVPGEHTARIIIAKSLFRHMYISPALAVPFCFTSLVWSVGREFIHLYCTTQKNGQESNPGGSSVNRPLTHCLPSHHKSIYLLPCCKMTGCWAKQITVWGFWNILNVVNHNHRFHSIIKTQILTQDVGFWERLDVISCKNNLKFNFF